MFSMSGKAFFLLGPIAKKTRCRVKIIKKIGMPFKFYPLKRRKLFLIGFVLSLLMIITLSFFVWHIEIIGNSEYTTEEMITYLKEEQNIEMGSFKPNINCAKIDDILLSHFDNTMWVSSELRGTQLIINVREGIKSSDEIKDDHPSDLVATKDGTILSIVMRKGTPLVKQGDVVKKGDILVSGTLEIKELQILKAVDFTYSDADIYIQTLEPYEDSIEYTYIDKQYWKDKEKKDTALKIFHTDINLLKPRLKENLYDKMVKYNQVQLFKNFYLPIYTTKTTYMPYYELEKTYTVEEAKAILTENFERTIQNLIKMDIQILSNDVIFKEDVGKLVLTGHLIVAEKTGEIVYFDENLRKQEYNKFFTEENGENP